MNEWRHKLPSFVKVPDPGIYEFGVPLFFDFETTNHSKGSAIDQRNNTVCVAWQLGWNGEVQLEWGNEWELVRFMEAVEQADVLVAHNAKFDLMWLYRCGFPPASKVVYDTQIAEYVIGGNRYQLSKLSLEKSLKRHGLPGKENVVSNMIKRGICPSEIPREWLAMYAIQDVAALPKLMGKQLEVMRHTRLLPVVYNRCLLTPVLADIERNGMQLDADLVRTKYTELQAELQELTKRMNKMTGGINVRSGVQLGAYLYDELGFDEVMEKRGRDWLPRRTASGRRATDADTISRLKAKTKAQREFLSLYTEVREVDTQLTKYLAKFDACCKESGGILKAQFNQCNTQTHRLSSSGLQYTTQFQNLPRAYKRFFKAKRPGYVVVEVDGSQLEFRVAAHMGRDEAALQDIRQGVDVHSFTAGVLTEAGQETDRQGAKEHTFKPLYGGSSGTEAEKAYYAAFKSRYPGIASAQQDWIAHVLEHKFLETEWGLRYYWGDTKRDRSGYITNTTSICNYPVQAFATAEIIPAALVLLWHLLNVIGLEAEIVNTIHDSIVAEVSGSDVKAYNELVKWAMVDGVYEFIYNLYGIKLVCQLGCGIKVAEHWAQTKDEIKYERGQHDDSEDRTSREDVREGMERAIWHRNSPQLPA